MAGSRNRASVHSSTPLDPTVRCKPAILEAHDEQHPTADACRLKSEVQTRAPLWSQSICLPER